MPPKKKVEKLSATIEKLLAARGLASKLQEYRLAGQWERAVGPVIAQHTQPAALRGKKLTVVVDSSAWMQQLALLRPEIIAKVNETLGETAVKGIVLRLGEVSVHSKGASRKPVRPAASLGPEERSRIEEYIAAVADPDAREALRHLIEKDFLFRKENRTNGRSSGSAIK